jgi:transcriptional regulator with XRE-family HTH domain
MSEQDLKQLRQVLGKAVKAAGLTNREVEHRLGIGSGNIYRLLDGRLDLRVRHLLALADLLEIPPSDLLELGCPGAVSRAKRRLGDVIGQRPSQPAEPAAASPSLDQLKELIRTAVHEEMEQRSVEPERTRRSRR